MIIEKNFFQKTLRVGLFCCIFFLGTGALAQNVVPDQQEFDALKALYDNLGGSAWTNKTNWPLQGNWPATATAAQMDTWFGITVTNGDITGIDLRLNNLTGSIPASIGQLEKLYSLYLYDNKITGALPSSIGQLSGLNVLNISSNQIADELPVEVGQLIKLVTFDIHANKFAGALPTSLANLVALQTFNVGNNLFTGEMVDLSGCMNLSSLTLSKNQFTAGTIPSWITSLTNLAYLDMAECRRNGQIPTNISQLTKLQSLYLNDNRLSGSMPETLFDLPNLRILHLYNNELSGNISPSVEKLANLTFLHLGGNRFSGTIPSSIGALTQLQSLYLSNNMLTGGIPPSIGNLSNLITLYLSTNSLSGPLPVTLNRLKKLKFFYAMANQLSGDLAMLEDLPALTTLQLSNNQFTGNIPDSFKNFSNLQNLYLNGNKLTGPIPASLGNLINLQIFYVSNNELSGEIPATFSNWTKLNYFAIDGNQLGGTFPNILTSWPQVTSIIIGNSSKPSNQFSGPFPDVSGLSKLAVITANYNRFTSIPSSILSLPLLNSLSFFSTELETVPDLSSQANRSNLTVHLANNRIDFSGLEPLIGSGIKTVNYAPQKTIEGVPSINLTEGLPLVISACNPGQLSSVTWEKFQNGSWVNINSSDQDANLQTYTRTTASLSDAGDYRWKMTNTKVTGMTLQSGTIAVKTAEQFTLDTWAFQYKYDARKRVTHKKVPGADWVYMVYDNRDRLVMTQDGEQRKLNKWSNTKYDALNRPIMTGIYTHASYVDQQGMSGLINTTNFFETYNGAAANHGYTNTVFPIDVLRINILNVTYYDKYDFIPDWGSDFDYKQDDVEDRVVNNVIYEQPASESPRVIGQVTGTKSRQLGEAGYILTASYFDDKYRAVQTISRNSKGGIDRTTILYDFTGKVLASKMSHNTRDVRWTQVTGAVLEGTTIRSTTLANWSAGAASAQLIAANTNGWFEVTVEEVSQIKVFGVSEQKQNNNYSSVDYAMYFPSGTSVTIYENGVIKSGSTTVAVGDILRIERLNGTILYKKNGVQFALSQTTSASQLMADVSFFNQNGKFGSSRTSDSPPEISITRQFDYDHAGRLLKTWHQLGSGQPVLLAQNEYNELGQLVTKKLHNEDPAATLDASRSFKQLVDYRYNIRGWLTQINDSEITSPAGNAPRDLFGMNLFYNESRPELGNATAFNGNISAMKWSANAGQVADIRERSYVFGYDAMNRLESADHGIRNSINVWSPTNDYNEDNLSYDLNGNIKKLNRTAAGGTTPMDILQYTYEGNQLQGVADTGDKSNGFVDGNDAGDYAYDANGNLIRDQNKLITSITYNNLNLPDKVTKNNGEYVKYVYSATGAKLSQGVYTASNSQVKKTDYSGEFVYENDVLQLINHEEGRIVMEGQYERVPPPQLVSNNDAATAAGFFSNQNVTLSSETIGGETYLKVTSNGTISTPGFMTDYITVTPGKSYRYKLKGYATAYTAYMWVQGENGSNIVFYTVSLPIGSANENWMEVIFTVPANVARVRAGALWSQGVLNETMFINAMDIRSTEETIEQATSYTPIYQYHMKDHLGNVRVTFTSKDEIENDKATLETENAEQEQSKFLNYDEAITVNHEIFDRTSDGTTNETYNATRLVGGTTNQVYGLARSLSVMPGDEISMEVYAKYLDPEPENWTGSYESFLDAYASSAPPEGSIIDGGVSGSIGNGLFPFPAFIMPGLKSEAAPKAYLNWIVCDRDYNPILGECGFVQIGSTGTLPKENGTNIAHEWLKRATPLKINQPGYVYIYLSNENETSVEVFFDDFKVEHKKSPVVQMDDYYPFGLTFNSYSRENSTENRYLYNQGTGDKKFNTERVTDLGLNIDLTKYRAYDPAIGRWWQVDPKTDELYGWTPYNYAFNNPILYNDPEGDIPPLIWAILAIAALVLDAEFAEAPGTDQSPAAQQRAQENREYLRDANETVKTVVNPQNIVKKVVGAQVRDGVKKDLGSQKTTEKTAETSKAARREVMREEGIPTSQQPSSQSKNKSGREYTYEVPKEGGGTQKKSVQQQTMDESHKDQPHWEAGKVKTDESGNTRMNNHGRPKLENDKSKVYYKNEGQ
jgi:RHS repeat-associated protein